MVTFDVVMAHLFTISHCDVDPNNFVFHENRNFYETSLLVMSILIIFFSLNFGVKCFSYRDKWFLCKLVYKIATWDATMFGTNGHI